MEINLKKEEFILLTKHTAEKENIQHADPVNITYLNRQKCMQSISFKSPLLSTYMHGYI
jgi:hypothetical protein